MLKFITGNKNKFLEIERVLMPLKIDSLKIDLEEIQDLDPYRVIGHKLNQALKHQTNDFFIEDTSLVFKGLSKRLPGTYIKFFLDELGAEGLFEFVKKLGNQNFEMRTIIAYVANAKKTYFFESKLKGKIVAPKGSGGFGLDPILRPAGSKMTLGELKALGKYQLSTRYKAAFKFKRFLVKMATLKINDKQKALAVIAGEIETCKICQKDKIGKAVPGEGGADADIVFLGEAPGKKEAGTGRPFVGPAGKVLRELIKDAGLKDEEVYITSPVKYLPKYVTPTPEDIAHGRTHLLKQLEVINPKVIVLMGRVAVLAMLGRNVSVAREHGTIIKQDGRSYLLTYHPAAQLYSPKVKEELVKDFKMLKKLSAYEKIISQITQLH